jgi:hypothetical protein
MIIGKSIKNIFKEKSINHQVWDLMWFNLKFHITSELVDDLRYVIRFDVEDALTISEIDEIR